MTLWIRIGIVLFMLAGSYGLGAYVKGKFDRAAEADNLEIEMAGIREQVAAKDEKSARTEADLQAERQANADLNRKWSKIRASEDRSVCLLDADTISLLQSAGTGRPDAR